MPRAADCTRWDDKQPPITPPPRTGLLHTPPIMPGPPIFHSGSLFVVLIGSEANGATFKEGDCIYSWSRFQKRNRPCRWPHEHAPERYQSLCAQARECDRDPTSCAPPASSVERERATRWRYGRKRRPARSSGEAHLFNWNGLTRPLHHFPITGSADFPVSEPTRTSLCLRHRRTLGHRLRLLMVL